MNLLIVFLIVLLIIFMIRKRKTIQCDKRPEDDQKEPGLSEHTEKKTDIPPMIRILPMDRKFEFEDMEIKEVQSEFFLEELPSREDEYGKGRFRFKKSGMKAEPGTIVLFQYDGKIIASAEITDIIKYEKLQVDENNEGYNGAYYFDPDKINVFEPLDNDDIKSIWGEQGFIDSGGKEHPGFKGFHQTKWFLDPQKYPEFCERLENVQTPRKNSGTQLRS